MSLLIHKQPKDRAFDAINYTLLAVLVLSIILPFWHLLSQSFSAPGYASSGHLMLLPKEFTLNNYKTIANNRYIWIGYQNTLFRTVVGTALSLILTAVAAYCLANPRFPHRTFWTFFIVFTMFFSGGLIPTFLLIKDLRLLDSSWSLILPGAVGAYNVVIMRNYFQQLPKEIEEAAKIDGAGEIRTLFRIIFPISTPMLATVALWIAVGHWNSWFDCLVYIRDTSKFVVQIVLRRIVLEGTQQMMDSTQAMTDFKASPEALKAACIFFTTLPILCIYPFIQKYFVKGIIMGSLKG